MADIFLQADGLTLKNKLGIENNPDLLRDLEYELVESRAYDLRNGDFEFSTVDPAQLSGFDAAHLRAIHRHLFQDVYEWAGQTRGDEIILEGRSFYMSGPMWKGADAFTASERVNQRMEGLAHAIRNSPGLRSDDPDQFTADASRVLGEVNAIHPFREGNGRTQRMFVKHLAARAGHDLSFEHVSQERMIAVSIASNRGDFAPTERLIAESLDPDRRAALEKSTAFLDKNGFDWNQRYIATTEPGREYSGKYGGADRVNFFMHDGENIHVGNMADLPRAFSKGEQISYRAGGEPHILPRPSIALDNLHDRDAGRER
ncbi:MAG: Fic family protein [Pseudomonadota bacterium]